MDGHPKLAEIALWVLERDSAELRPVVRDHLEGGCPVCHQLAGQLEHLAAVSSTAAATEPSPELVDRLRSLLKKPEMSDAEIAQGVLALIEDTRELVGVRNAAATGRYLTFGGQGVKVQLRLEPGSERRHYEILGHVEGAPPAPQLILQAHDADGVTAEAVLDASGEFEFDDEVPSPYRFKLVGAGVHLETEPLPQ